MKARTFKTLDDDVYKVSIYTQDWSENDISLMIKYEEPEIDIGGDFDGVATFTLPNALVRIREGSPFTVSFDDGDTGEAEDRANTWTTEILVRLNTAIVALRLNSDDFTSESVVAI